MSSQAFTTCVGGTARKAAGMDVRAPELRGPGSRRLAEKRNPEVIMAAKRPDFPTPSREAIASRTRGSPTSAEVKRTVGTAATGFDEQCIVGRRPPIQRWRGCRRAPGAHAR